MDFETKIYSEKSFGYFKQSNIDSIHSTNKAKKKKT